MEYTVTQYKRDLVKRSPRFKKQKKEKKYIVKPKREPRERDHYQYDIDYFDIDEFEYIEYIYSKYPDLDDNYRDDYLE